MTHPANPTSQQMFALTRVYACPGERFLNDIPRAVLRDCVKAGWMREDQDHYHLTPEGEKVWLSRK